MLDARDGHFFRAPLSRSRWRSLHSVLLDGGTTVGPGGHAVGSLRRDQEPDHSRTDSHDVAMVPRSLVRPSELGNAAHGVDDRRSR